MRRFSTEFKVGLLVCVAIGLIVYASVRIGDWYDRQNQSTSYFALMQNASGLQTGSPVRIAGVKAGQVKSVGIAGGEAKVILDIYKAHPLFEDARVTLRTIGILGDSYLELSTGTPEIRQLEEGEQIPFVGTQQNLDSLVAGVSDIITNVRAVTQRLSNSLGTPEAERKLITILDNMAQTSENLSQITGTTNARIDNILANVASLSGTLARIASDQEGNINTTLTELAGLSQELRALVSENRSDLRGIVENIATFSASLSQEGPVIAENISTFSQSLAEDVPVITGALAEDVPVITGALAEDVPAISGNLREVFGEQNRDSLSHAIAALEASLVDLEDTTRNLSAITTRIEQGEGTIGRLVNDETTVNKLDDTLDGLGEFVGGASKIKLDLGGKTEYLFSQEAYKSYITARLRPQSDREYVLQLVDDPRGIQTVRTLTREVDGVLENTTEVETSQELQASLLIGQRYYDTVVRGGLIEGGFGLGVEQYFGSVDQLSFELLVWDLDDEFGEHWKAGGRWNVFSGGFITFGADDFLSQNPDFRDGYLGIGLEFNEDNLRPLLSSLPGFGS